MKAYTVEKIVYAKPIMYSEFCKLMDYVFSYMTTTDLNDEQGYLVEDRNEQRNHIDFDGRITFVRAHTFDVNYSPSSGLNDIKFGEARWRRYCNKTYPGKQFVTPRTNMLKRMANASDVYFKKLVRQEMKSDEKR